jgi:hypothetical protein
MQLSPLTLFMTGLGRIRASATSNGTPTTVSWNDRHDGQPQYTHLETLSHIWTPRARRRVRAILGMAPTEPVTAEHAVEAAEHAAAKERTFRAKAKKS